MGKKISMFLFTLLTMLCLGLIYGWSVFVVPLETEFGWERAETSMTFTLSMISMCIGIMVSGQFNKHRDRAFVSLLIAAGLLLAGFILASRSYALIHFYVFYGVFCGFAVGFAYVEMISIPTTWFPGKQGLLSGILMMCFGLGAMILGTMCSSLMGYIGWRKTFIMLGLLFGIMVLIEGSLLQYAVKYGSNVNNGKSSITERGMDTRQMVRSADFKMLYIWHISISAAGLALMGHIAPCAIQIGASSAFAAVIAGSVSVSNGAGRIIYGSLYDILGVKKTLIIISTVFLAATLITSFAVSFRSIPVLILGCVLVGMSFGAAPTSSSAVVNRFYGTEFFSSNFGVISTQLIIAAMAGPYMAGKLYTATGDYKATFYGVIGLGIISLIFSFIVIVFAKKNGRHLEK